MNRAWPESTKFPRWADGTIVQTVMDQSAPLPGILETFEPKPKVYVEWRETPNLKCRMRIPRERKIFQTSGTRRNRSVELYQN